MAIDRRQFLAAASGQFMAGDIGYRDIQDRFEAHVPARTALPRRPGVAWAGGSAVLDDRTAPVECRRPSTPISPPAD